MSMPEAAMNKDYRSVFWKNHIRFAWKTFIMEFVTIAIGMKKLSNQHFRLCVLAFDAAHVIAAYFFGVHICHTIKL